MILIDSSEPFYLQRERNVKDIIQPIYQFLEKEQPTQTHIYTKPNSGLEKSTLKPKTRNKLWV